MTLDKLTTFEKRALLDAGDELHRAREKHSSMTSPHHGYAIILEELDELWDEVKAWRGSAWKGLSLEQIEHMATEAKQKMRKEAIQIAAMALRFVLDVAE